MTRDDVTPCCVYRYFDDAGALLYVGITVDLESRENGHEQSSVFTPFITDASVDWYPSAAVAAQVERDAIRAEAPIFNRALVPRNEKMARFDRAVAYLQARPGIQLKMSAGHWGLGHRSYPDHMLAQFDLG